MFKVDQNARSHKCSTCSIPISITKEHLHHFSPGSTFDFSQCVLLLHLIMHQCIFFLHMLWNNKTFYCVYSNMLVSDHKCLAIQLPLAIMKYFVVIAALSLSVKAPFPAMKIWYTWPKGRNRFLYRPPIQLLFICESYMEIVITAVEVHMSSESTKAQNSLCTLKILVYKQIFLNANLSPVTECNGWKWNIDSWEAVHWRRSVTALC